MVFGTFSPDAALWEFELLEDCRGLSVTGIV